MIRKKVLAALLIFVMAAAFGPLTVKAEGLPAVVGFDFETNVVNSNQPVVLKLITAESVDTVTVFCDSRTINGTVSNAGLEGYETWTLSFTPEKSQKVTVYIRESSNLSNPTTFTIPVFVNGEIVIGDEPDTTSDVSIYSIEETGTEREVILTVTVSREAQRVWVNYDTTRFTQGKLVSSAADNRTWEIKFKPAEPQVVKVYANTTYKVAGAASEMLPILGASPTATSAPAAALSEADKMEAEVLTLVNAERQKAGLSALRTTDAIKRAADTRAAELADEFSHDRPDGRSCFTALAEEGVAYSASGENIAMGQNTAAKVMDSWMKSSGHKANILSDDFNVIGIGCYEDNGTYYWVQLFID
jgi:uncharacterized protein YkwD